MRGIFAALTCFGNFIARFVSLVAWLARGLARLLGGAANVRGFCGGFEHFYARYDVRYVEYAVDEEEEKYEIYARYYDCGYMTCVSAE